MIKRIVHIDRNYPRKFNGIDQATAELGRDANWSFDTRAQTDDIEGDIDVESQYKIDTHTSDDSNPDQLFSDRTATDTQYDNLTENGQIRFNANVFNYIVHTSIENVVLKYDAPVVYAEGKQLDIAHDDYAWQETYAVVEGWEYQIGFDILLHDPMGLDALSYEAWVGDARCTVVNRKTQQQVACAVFDDAGNPSERFDIPVDNSAYLRIKDLKFEKLRDKYVDADISETAFKIKVTVGGERYTDDFVNTDESLYNAWLDVINDASSTEEQITNAWQQCNGIKFKFFDVAGNVTYWVMPHIIIKNFTIEDFYNLKKLTLDFINTRPADLQLGDDLIGRTTVRVLNPNASLATYPIVITLDEASLGDLYKSTHKEVMLAHNGKITSKIATEDVGNIDDSGWVIAHAYIDVTDFYGDLEFVRTMIQSVTRADGSLGEWIKECADNTRKLTLDPFVPQYLKETTNKNAAYYKFVKFTERYLNTMFKAYDKNCYISILEAIARIGNFNDYTTIYKNLLDKYDDDHGDMLHVTGNELATLIDVDKEEYEDET